jgi:hypothetical protein
MTWGGGGRPSIFQENMCARVKSPQWIRRYREVGASPLLQGGQPKTAAGEHILDLVALSIQSLAICCGRPALGSRWNARRDAASGEPWVGDFAAWRRSSSE